MSTILLFLVALVAGVLIAYSNYRFFERGIVNVWIVAGIGLVLSIGGLVLEIGADSLLGTFLFLIGAITLVYVSVSAFLIAYEEEPEEEAVADNLQDRIDKMVNESKNK